MNALFVFIIIVASFGVYWCLFCNYKYNRFQKRMCKGDFCYTYFNNSRIYGIIIDIDIDKALFFYVTDDLNFNAVSVFKRDLYPV